MTSDFVLRMNVKQAVAIAKQHIRDLFGDESIEDLGLEEVEFDEGAGEWLVTLGFSRPWDRARNSLARALEEIPRRSFKIVRISDPLGQVTSVKDWEARVEAQRSN